MSTNHVMGTTGRCRRRNRSWPEELRREIVAASYEPGTSVSKVARRYDVNANQVFNWRKLYCDIAGVPASEVSPQLVAVTIVPEKPSSDAISGTSSDIAIEVGGRYRIRIGDGFAELTLRRVLDVLEGR